MLPLRIEERDHPDFDEPIVELWREDEFVGYVFWDVDVAVVQVYPDADGEPYDLDVDDLIRVLDAAQRIVTPDAFADDPDLTTLADRIEEEATIEGGDAVDRLRAEVASRAAYRDEDGEGFYSLRDALAIVERCDRLDLAVVEIEGLRWDGRTVEGLAGHHLVVEEAPGAEWTVFRPQANATVAGRLATWPDEPRFLVAVAVRRRDGEVEVL